MQRFLLRCSVTAMVLLVTLCSTSVQAQVDTTPTSLDPALITWQNSKIPKEYTIADVKITGIKFLDTSIVYSIANLQPGDKFNYPGTDVFAKSIAALWRQKFFSGVQVYVTRVQDDRVWIEIAVVERPRLGSYKFIGVKNQTRMRSLRKLTSPSKQSLQRIHGVN